jgi:hypothetical protein
VLLLFEIDLFVLNRENAVDSMQNKLCKAFSSIHALYITMKITIMLLLLMKMIVVYFTSADAVIVIVVNDINIIINFS